MAAEKGAMQQVVPNKHKCFMCHFINITARGHARLYNSLASLLRGRALPATHLPYCRTALMVSFCSTWQDMLTPPCSAKYRQYANQSKSKRPLHPTPPLLLPLPPAAAPAAAEALLPAPGAGLAPVVAAGVEEAVGWYRDRSRTSADNIHLTPLQHMTNHGENGSDSLSPNGFHPTCAADK